MRSPRPLAERLVWQCLENHANGARFWPMSEEAIARELSLGVATVARAVRALVASNIVRAEQHKRRPTVFYMLRVYGKPNGQHEPHQEELTTHNDGSTTELSDQSDGSTGHLTTQNDRSTTPAQMDLTHQNDRPTPELTHQNDRTSYPPVKNPPERKEEPPLGPPQSRGGRPQHALPDDWVPGPKAFALAAGLGLTNAEVLFEADKMRDWGLATNGKAANWDARFNNWLRKEAGDRRTRRYLPAKPTLAEEWGLTSFLTPTFDDDEPEPPRLLS